MVCLKDQCYALCCLWSTFCILEIFANMDYLHIYTDDTQLYVSVCSVRPTSEEGVRDAVSKLENCGLQCAIMDVLKLSETQCRQNRSYGEWA